MDYNNGKIYSIRSNQTDMFYIGSTTQPLYKRLSKHKSNYIFWKKNDNKKRYITSCEIMKYDDAFIELIEDYPCESKNQLTKREGELIRAHKSNCVNCRIEGRTGAEYRQDNKEYKAEYSVKHYQANKEHYLECQGKYYQANKEHIKEYSAEYYQSNKELIAEHNKQRNSTKIICETCKRELCRNSLSRHVRALHPDVLKPSNEN